MLKIRIRKLNKDAIIPKYAHEGDSGLDLYSIKDEILGPNERKLIPIGIKLEIPQGYEAQVRPKSGLALNYGIGVLNSPGTIDSGFRGEIQIIVINLGKEDYEVKKGEKIAQLVFQKVEKVEFVEEELNESKRGDGGFGSTGKK